MGFRIWLSPPHVGAAERALLLEAFDSNWIAPLGPQVDAFEAELAQACDVSACAALSSGTAALHLALLELGVGPGARVVTSTLTFAATAHAITYVGAEPVFVDVDPMTWQMDPARVREYLSESAIGGHEPAAIITVDLYGGMTDHAAVGGIAAEFRLPVIEDAAEALGSSWDGVAAGAHGDIGVLSFNGNKIITTSGGGALLSSDESVVERARWRASQAREPARHYEHNEIGFNYRLSNLLAGVGRGQLAGLADKVDRRSELNARYRDGLGALPGVRFQGHDPRCRPSNWLTCLTINPDEAGITRNDVIDALATADIEARPVWKPMHLQPVFVDRECVFVGEEDHAARLFEHGLCLPSGSSLTDVEQDEVIDRVRACFPDAT